MEPAELIGQYYNMLDTSDYNQVPVVLAYSITTLEGDYTTTYSQKEYEEFLKWDAQFDPAYEVLDISPEENGVYKATVSKMDKRIAFLMKSLLSRTTT